MADVDVILGPFTPASRQRGEIYVLSRTLRALVFESGAVQLLRSGEPGFAIDDREAARLAHAVAQHRVGPGAAATPPGPDAT